MVTPRTNRPKPHGFLNLPVVTEWQNLDADAVIFGAPFGKPYDPAEFPNDQSTAPSARIGRPVVLAMLDHACCLDV